MKSKKTRKHRKLKQAVYEAALFIDNDPGYIADFHSCQGIDTLKVGGASVPPEIRADSPSAQAYRRRLSSKGQVLFDFFKEFQLETASPENVHAYIWYDARSGIQPWHIPKIKTWIRNQQGKNAAVLLDFDRTLTVQEGFYSMEAQTLAAWKSKALSVFKGPDKEKWQHLLEPIEWSDILEFYCGGSKRLAMLKKLIHFANQHGVDTYILTANPTCSENPNMFSSLVKDLHSTKIPLLCAASTGGRVNKRLSLLRGPVGSRFAALCDTRGLNSTRRKEHR